MRVNAQDGGGRAIRRSRGAVPGSEAEDACTSAATTARAAGGRQGETPVFRRSYTGELVAASGPKPIRKLVESTVALQDVLGEHQDACVTQHLVMRLLEGLGEVVDTSVAFVAGRLVEREEVRRVATRQSWPAAWRRVQRRAQSLELAACLTTARPAAAPRRQPDCQSQSAQP